MERKYLECLMGYLPVLVVTEHQSWTGRLGGQALESSGTARFNTGGRPEAPRASVQSSRLGRWIPFRTMFKDMVDERHVAFGVEEVCVNMPRQTPMRRLMRPDT